MTKEQLISIFEKTDSDWQGDNAWQGLQIIEKYMKDKTIITGAEHDEIFSVDVDEILESGLTEEDAQKLARLNWSCNDVLSCFV